MSSDGLIHCVNQIIHAFTYLVVGIRLTAVLLLPYNWCRTYSRNRNITRFIWFYDHSLHCSVRWLIPTDFYSRLMSTTWKNNTQSYLLYFETIFFYFFYLCFLSYQAVTGSNFSRIYSSISIHCYLTLQSMKLCAYLSRRTWSRRWRRLQKKNRWGESSPSRTRY